MVEEKRAREVRKGNRGEGDARIKGGKGRGEKGNERNGRD